MAMGGVPLYLKEVNIGEGAAQALDIYFFYNLQMN
jgi:hypothetical protein